MDVKCLIFGIEISHSDWEKTPPSVKELVEKLGQRINTSETAKNLLGEKFSGILNSDRYA